MPADAYEGGPERASLVFPASESPEADAVRREPDLHLLMAERGERTARLDADAGEQGEYPGSGVYAPHSTGSG